MNSKFFCFTRHANHGSLEEEDIRRILEPLCQYFVFQTEVCPNTQREHVQGYVVLNVRSRSTTFARNFPSHVEKRNGTHSQAKLYCQKEETRKPNTNYTEYGTFNDVQGTRNDLVQFRDAILAGDSNWALLETFPREMAKYPRFVQLVRTEQLRYNVLRNIPVLQPRLGWQFALAQTLEAAPNSRTVHWRWDGRGNVGKSHFALHYKPGETFVITGGKHADTHYAYQYEKYVFFDYPRCNQESFPYGLVEQFKNGYFLSTKYESYPKRFLSPHVVVFTNFAPDISQMSLDRWDIMEIIE